MKTQETLTNEELIDYVYYDIAGKYLNEKIDDWSQTKKWYNTVFTTPCIINCFGRAYLENSFGIFSRSFLFTKLVA
jgi:surface polysaccharide O-acyltransferase-like enzyme